MDKGWVLGHKGARTSGAVDKNIGDNIMSFVDVLFP